MHLRSQLFTVGSLAISALLAVALFAFSFGATGVAAQEDDTIQRSVTAHGFAIVEAEPDMVTLEFEVVGEGDDTDDAGEDAEAIAEVVIDILEDEGIDAEAIEVSEFDERDRATDAERVAMHITAQTDDVDGAEAIANTVTDETDAELTNVGYLLEDVDEIRQEAREAALEDARQSADELAALADGSLGEIISINQISTPAIGPQTLFGEGSGGPLGLGMFDTSEFENMLENLLGLVVALMFGMDGMDSGNIQFDDIFGDEQPQDFFDDDFTQSVPVTLEVTWAIQ